MSVLEVSSGMEGVVVVGQTDTIVSENVEAAQEVNILIISIAVFIRI